uniref:PPM-type phosphatase domain-containing protein n=1 Tax=Noctiluca scintillans TaxID=2966 RepID=A0A7S1FE23_NOCSC
MVAAGPPSICYLCRRKFPSRDLLIRHERMSDFHRQNTEKQEEHTQHRKDELRSAITNLRQMIYDIDGSVGGAEEAVQAHRTVLEMQLRQLLGEYGQAQELLEDCRNQKLASRDGASAKRVLTREARVGKLMFSAGVSSWRGNKDVQEDRYLIEIELLSPEGLAIAGFAVLDGHSGSLCVDQMVERLPANLQKCLSTKPSLTEEYLTQAVTEACLLTDDEFLHKARELEVLDGSTLILALIFPETGHGAREAGACRVLIANVGDSRAVLCRACTNPDGEPGLAAVRLSEDHKPGRADEQRRIEAQGGLVDVQGVWRVFTPGPTTFGGRAIARWGLAVSRAFGDLLLKEPERFGCSGVLPGGLINAIPEIQTVDISASDRFLVLACDGVWDVLSDEESVVACAGQNSCDLAANALVRRSFAAGSDDNLTALILTWRSDGS